MFKDSFLSAQQTRSILITKISLLTLYTQMTAVCCKEHKDYRNILRKQKVELSNVKTAGT